MSLATRILDTLTRKKTGAKAAYLAALRNGRPADEIAAAADAAGIDPAQIQADADILDRAAELRQAADKLPAQRKATANAQAVLDAAGRALDAAIAKLQPPVDNAALDVQGAQAAEREGRNAAGALAGLYNERPDLLDAASAPAVVKEIWTADAARESAEDAGRAKVARVDAARLKVREAEGLVSRIVSRDWPYHLNDGGGLVDVKTMELRRDEYLAKARAALVKAEDDLAAAKAAAKA